MLTKFIVVSISQYRHISNHYVVQFELICYVSLYISIKFYVSIKLEKNLKNKNRLGLKYFYLFT